MDPTRDEVPQLQVVLHVVRRAQDGEGDPGVRQPALRHVLLLVVGEDVQLRVDDGVEDEVTQVAVRRRVDERVEQRLLVDDLRRCGVVGAAGTAQGGPEGGAVAKVPDDDLGGAGPAGDIGLVVVLDERADVLARRGQAFDERASDTTGGARDDDRIGHAGAPFVRGGGGSDARRYAKLCTTKS
ncbi:MAG: hypothetical protein PGN07_03490 [Aeromicrobium erythreum]